MGCIQMGACYDGIFYYDEPSSKKKSNRVYQRSIPPQFCHDKKIHTLQMKFDFMNSNAYVDFLKYAHSSSVKLSVILTRAGVFLIGGWLCNLFV